MNLKLKSVRIGYGETSVLLEGRYTIKELQDIIEGLNEVNQAARGEIPFSEEVEEIH